MNVKKEVYEKCVGMIQSELHEATRKLNRNRYDINNLAKQQRILKAECGKLHEMLRELKK